MGRQIDKMFRRALGVGKCGTAASVGLMLSLIALPSWASPADDGFDEAPEKREVGDHLLLLDMDEIAKAVVAQDSPDDDFESGAVEFGSSVNLGANVILLRGLTLGGLVNLARSKDHRGDRSTLGGAFRAGYLIPLGGAFTLWPNASIGYSRGTGPYRIDGIDQSFDRDEKVHTWHVGGEARLLAAVADHLGLSAGLKYSHVIATASTFDDQSVDNWEQGQRALSADLGLAVWF